MKSSLSEEISIELELMANVVHEVSSLCHDVTGRQPTVRENTAAASFLAQFYGGVENILKRIHRYYKIPLPVGNTWHLELFNRFCPPGYDELPLLFDNKLSMALSPFRKFRHVVHHGYGFQIEWEMMSEGLENLDSVFCDVTVALKSFLDSLPEN